MYSWEGYDYDTGSGLYLEHARVYDSVSQRWMSQDPMGFDAGDSNLYRYVNNAPTDATDPSGRYLITSTEGDAKKIAASLGIGQSAIVKLPSGKWYVHTDSTSRAKLFQFADSKWDAADLFEQMGKLAKKNPGTLDGPAPIVKEALEKWIQTAVRRNQFLFASGAIGDDFAGKVSFDPTNPTALVTLESSDLKVIADYRKEAFSKENYKNNAPTKVQLDLAGEGDNAGFINVNIQPFVTPGGAVNGEFEKRIPLFVYGDARNLSMVIGGIDVLKGSTDSLIIEGFWGPGVASNIMNVMKPTGGTIQTNGGREDQRAAVDLQLQGLIRALTDNKMFVTVEKTPYESGQYKGQYRYTITFSPKKVP